MSLSSLESLAERNRDGVLLLARILLAAIFVPSGFGKLMGFEGFAASLAAKGLPLPLLWAVAGVAAEFGGSLLILFGLGTRLLAPVMVIFVAFAAVLSHPFWATDAEHYQAQYINFMKNIAIMGGYLALFVAGPGAISLDGWLRRRG
jgi:putative oxidoreductase